jgi:hypothetical protein
MSENSSDAGQNPQPSTETVPYTIAEQDGTVNVAFTSGPQQGDNFQIDRPQGVGAGQPNQATPGARVRRKGSNTEVLHPLGIEHS